MLGKIRTFDTGATRDTDTNKPDFRGFFSVLAARRFAEYMNQHRVQSDGSIRNSDNWKQGIPNLVYVSSMYRHFMDVLEWFESARFDYATKVDLETSLCALLFNVQGLLHEVVKERMRYNTAVGLSTAIEHMDDLQEYNKYKEKP